jgi:pimeloyl-ACP methyl ester carboxylesterase
MHRYAEATRTLINATSHVSPRLAGRIAFEVWRRPFSRRRVRSIDRAVHEAADVSHLHVDGRSVVVYQWGDGDRPVLLVHGWQSRASRFHALITSLLEAGYSPVSYDAPGHGDTEGPAGTVLHHETIIRGLAERHGTFHGLIAHSAGVLFALYAARESAGNHRTITHRVVAVSGICEFGYFVDGLCEQLRLRPAVNKPLRRSIESSLFGNDPTIWRRFSADQPAKGCELLVIHDTEDTVVNPEQAKLLAGAYGTNVSPLWTTGLGHHDIVSAPLVVKTATAFLDRA